MKVQSAKLWDRDAGGMGGLIWGFGRHGESGKIKVESGTGEQVSRIGGLFGGRSPVVEQVGDTRG